MTQLFDFFLDSYKSHSNIDILLEFLAFFFGILSVIYAQKENILVYPFGIDMYCNYSLYSLQRSIFRGYDDEYILLNNEFLWLVELVKEE